MTQPSLANVEGRQPGQRMGELSIKLADAALVARERGDDVNAIFFAIKAAETLQLAKLFGWQGPTNPDAGAS